MAEENSKKKFRGLDPRIVTAYAGSELGRRTIERELVESAQFQKGDRVLVLHDSNATDGMDEVVRVATEILRQRGACVTVIQSDEFVPVIPGTDQGAWYKIEKHKLPGAIYEAIRLSDVIVDYTVNSRGAQKYNENFYTLAMYYNKRIYAYRAVEAPEVLSTDPDSPIASPQALSYPSELLRAIATRVIDGLLTAAKAKKEFRLTNPWGTDIRFIVLPGDLAQNAGAVRRLPNAPFDYAGGDNNRVWNALIGFAVPQTCDGVWVTRHCSLLGGNLERPVTVRFEGGFITGAEGDQEAVELMAKIGDEPAGIHGILIGMNPKASPFRDGRYLFNNTGAGAGVSHLGMGGPGLFFRRGEWGPIGNKHFQLGNIPKVSLWAGTEPVFEQGRLLALEDPAVREEARRYGDPDELLSQFPWPDVPL